MSTTTPILCADGTIISVQASSGHYCSPRADNPNKGYGSVEVRVNNGEPVGWMQPARVLELINEHGGAIGGRLPPLNFGHYEVSEGDEEE